MRIQLNHHTFTINSASNKDYWERINSTCWEPHSFSILDYFINENSTVLDIGAWSGVLTLYAAKKAKTVHALDPDPVCFKELKANIALNPSINKKVKTYQTAISDKEEIVHLSARESYGKSSSSILKRKRDREQSFRIKTTTLFQFLEKENIKYLDFIKMDVEGAEFKILPHLGEVINKYNHPTLYVSFHYSFLNEHIYFKHIPFKFLNKSLMKLERVFKISFFKKKINKDITNLFNELESYKYIYTTNKKELSFEELNHNQELIKDHDLVFTNTKWI